MINRLKFKSASTAAISYVEFNDSNKTYSTNYYFANGGWEKSDNVRLKDVREAIKRCESLGYTKVDRCEE